MKIMRAYKVELDPNNAQRTALLRHCGAARFVYNWGLSQKLEARRNNQKPLGAQKLDGVLRGVMTEEFPWLTQVSSQCRQGALANLDRAYKNFFDRCKKGKTGKATGFPKFKSRKKGLGGFAVFGYVITTNTVKIARVGTVRLKEKNYLPLGGYGRNTVAVRFFGARVTEKAGRWFIAVQVEIEAPNPAPRSHSVGVDVGIKSLASCSDGLVFKNPKALKANLRQLRRLSKSQSRKYEASKKRNRPLRECKNFQKSKKKLVKMHAKIGNIRHHALHHASHVITRKSNVIGVESLNIAGMMKNRCLARAVADASMGELLRQIQYKSAWHGGTVVEAGRWFASSKTCHSCGLVNTGMTLAQRKWMCECGVLHDRDNNAAMNLLKVAVSQTDTKNDCGEERSGALLAKRETSLCEAVSGQEMLSVSPTSAENGSIPVVGDTLYLPL